MLALQLQVGFMLGYPYNLFSLDLAKQVVRMKGETSETSTNITSWDLCIAGG